MRHAFYCEYYWLTSPLMAFRARGSMDILLTGSVAYDYLMTFPGRFTESLVADQLDGAGETLTR